ncbi:hypothetical protein P3X46_005849 [Hevea brasiliensis]|uniref:protein-serine/threonine phosphatase n=1 Tax=Hevea brasiliensis TaxID=3981 RepID=A0ABQ9MRR5_HEVBR|nr:hypothetical protein P3X46_005849 [Hevea brasiliensis]
MVQALMNLLSLCFRPFGHDSCICGKFESVGREGKDGLLWYRDIGRYGSRDFSMAVVQANQVLEDQSQIESGSFGTFVGVYDGHGGPDASRYVCDRLFRHFQAMSAEAQGVLTAETIQRAFHATEEGFTALVPESWATHAQIATTGSCCLVGVIFQQTLFKVGNAGEIAAIQLSTEHNANNEATRQELMELDPNDPQIVVLKHGVWRVKGIIHVISETETKFRLPEPMNMPILSAKPTIISHPFQPNDSFLIFASDGLWEHSSNEKAVDIVHSHLHAGSAKRLVKAALREAARKREMRYSDLRRTDKKVRRHFHDDITVIVLFLNHDLLSKGTVQDPPLSIRSALEH